MSSVIHKFKKINQTFLLKRYYFSGLDFLWWVVFLEGSFQWIAQGYNCGNLPADNRREKARKALCLGYCPVWTGPKDSRRVISIYRRRCTRQWPWQCFTLGLPRSFLKSRFFSLAKLEHKTYSSWSDMTSSLSCCTLLQPWSLKMRWTDEQLFKCEMRICEGNWIGGVERRGKEAQHMASFSEVKWRPNPIHVIHSLHWPSGPFCCKEHTALFCFWWL